jgi:hypothetical protein
MGSDDGFRNPAFGGSPGSLTNPGEIPGGGPFQELFHLGPERATDPGIEGTCDGGRS